MIIRFEFEFWQPLLKSDQKNAKARFLIYHLIFTESDKSKHAESDKNNEINQFLSKKLILYIFSFTFNFILINLFDLAQIWTKLDSFRILPLQKTLKTNKITHFASQKAQIRKQFQNCTTFAVFDLESITFNEKNWRSSVRSDFCLSWTGHKWVIQARTFPYSNKY